jgi:hypothetical protein
MSSSVLCLRPLRNQPAPHGDYRSRRAVGGAEFLNDALHVIPDRVGLDHQSPGRRTIGQPINHHLEHRLRAAREQRPLPQQSGLPKASP